MPSTTEVTLELAKPEKSDVLDPKPNRGCPATIVLAFAAMFVGITSKIYRASAGSLKKYPN